MTSPRLRNFFPFHPTRSAGLRKMHFDVNSSVGSVPRTNFTILAVCIFRFPPPTSVAVKKLHVVRALGFCSALIFPGFEKLEAHWLQLADSHSAISQQPVAMVTPAQLQADAAALKYMIQPSFAKHQCFLCCCHHKPTWCLLLAPQVPLRFPACLDSTACCAYVRAGNFADGIVFTPLDHLQPNYSPLWHLYLWAIRPDRFQQEGSNGVVNASAEGSFKISREKKVRRWWRWR